MATRTIPVGSAAEAGRLIMEAFGETPAVGARSMHISSRQFTAQYLPDRKTVTIWHDASEAELDRLLKEAVKS